ncbi:unnamed protein product, partial [Mesorhabditis spiculigera]
MQLSSIALTLVFTIFSPQMCISTQQEPLFCFTASISLSFGTFIQNLLALKDAAFPFRLALMCNLFTAATNVAGYSHAIFYRHQLSIPHGSWLKIPDYLQYFCFAVMYGTSMCFFMYVCGRISIVDFRNAHIYQTGVLEALIAREAVCTAGFKQIFSWVILAVMVVFFTGMMFFVIHSHYSLKNGHKKVQEMSQVLLISMASQTACFFVLLIIPISVLIVKYQDENFNEMWVIGTIICSSHNIVASLFIVFSTKSYRERLHGFFVNKQNGVQPPKIVISHSGTSVKPSSRSLFRLLTI